MHTTPPTHVRALADLDNERERAKLYRCPHCGRPETLNGHGLLRGYSERSSTQRVRGRRLFCSNRGKRLGCGKTVSVLLASCIARFSLRTSTLALFVLAVLAGASRKAAWEQLDVTMTRRSGYRLYARLIAAQSLMRAQLCKLAQPPDSTSPSPLAQLIDHINEVAPRATGDPLDIFARYQLRCQRHLLG